MNNVLFPNEINISFCVKYDLLYVAEFLVGIISAVYVVLLLLLLLFLLVCIFLLLLFLLQFFNFLGPAASDVSPPAAILCFYKCNHSHLADP
jgi:hypothetical protein